MTYHENPAKMLSHHHSKLITELITENILFGLAVFYHMSMSYRPVILRLDFGSEVKMKILMSQLLLSQILT